MPDWLFAVIAAASGITFEQGASIVVTALAGVVAYLFHDIRRTAKNTIHELRKEVNQSERRYAICEKQQAFIFSHFLRLLHMLQREQGNAERCAKDNEVCGGCPVAVPLAAEARNTEQMIESLQRFSKACAGGREAEVNRLLDSELARMAADDIASGRKRL